MLESLPSPDILQTWILPAMLGLGLAAASGLRIFIPLLMAALAARFQLFGIELNESMAWMTSNTAIAALGLATVLEVVADKIPLLDNALHAVGIVARPIAGAVAAVSVFAVLDPTAAAVAGIIVGAPTALAFGAAQGGTRAASTATTGGMANPFLSLMEDVLSVGTVLLAFLMPMLIPVALLLIFWGVWKLYHRWQRGRGPNSNRIEPAGG